MTRDESRRHLYCPMCWDDEKVFCPRDPDAQCLECGQKFCGAHIGQHLKEVHCISLDLNHCREQDLQGGDDKRN